jgi:hypothetical protein
MSQENVKINKHLRDVMGLSIECEFVPFSKSRNCKDSSKRYYEEPNWPSLNWKITLLHDGDFVLETDYSQGIAHVPGYEPLGNGGMSLHTAEIVKKAIERGRDQYNNRLRGPSLPDVMYSLLMDGSCYFYGESFDDWARDYDYDPDSREAEKIYKQCMEIGRQLFASLGNDVRQELSELFQDY